MEADVRCICMLIILMKMNCRNEKILQWSDAHQTSAETSGKQWATSLFDLTFGEPVRW